jgi:outer membrane protein TolC
MRYIIILFVLVSNSTFAQTYTLGNIQELAVRNYPLISQQDLLKNTEALTIKNIKSSLYPQMTINGQATYQSEVTSLTIPIPNFKADPLSKDQYKATAELQQTLYDGGLNKKAQAVAKSISSIEILKNEVELFKLNERVTQLYCSILYTDALLKQMDYIANDLNNGLLKVEALYKNGVVFMNNVLQVKAQILKNNQRIEEVIATKRSLYDAIALLTNTKMINEVVFVMPSQVDIVEVDDLNIRPELLLFDAQLNSFDSQVGLVNAKTQPKIGAFFQGGYGKPGLNMLKNDFDWFSITGVKFQWSLGSFYTANKEKMILNNQSGIVKNQKATYLLNNTIQLKQKLDDINKIEKLIISDLEIVDIRAQIKNTTLVQLDNGVISTNDYLKEVNEYDASKQILIQHQIQLVQSKLEYQLLKGKK